jgi:hypothetical protein
MKKMNGNRRKGFIAFSYSIQFLIFDPLNRGEEKRRGKR